MKVSKFIKSKLHSKSVLKEKPKVTVDVSQPVVEKDKSRFFKKAWDIERKRLFFE